MNTKDDDNLGCQKDETRIGETSDCKGKHPTESDLFKTCCCK
jgi:hypothetical protein